MTNDEVEVQALQDVLRLSRNWCARLDTSSPVAEDLDRLGSAAMKALEVRLTGLDNAR